MNEIDPKDFAAWYVKCGNSHDAAVFSGAKGNARLIGLRMLSSRKVRKYISELKERGEECGALVGLERIAFGRNNDAVRLALSMGSSEDIRSDDIESLDLFGVSEIKYGKNGVEIKFFDRIKALDALHGSQSRKSDSDSAQAFINALYGKEDES